VETGVGEEEGVGLGLGLARVVMGIWGGEGDRGWGQGYQQGMREVI